MTIVINQPKEGSFNRPNVVYLDEPYQWINYSGAQTKVAGILFAVLALVSHMV